MRSGVKFAFSASGTGRRTGNELGKGYGNGIASHRLAGLGFDFGMTIVLPLLYLRIVW